MIDLHLHLDGSLSLEDFKYLANRNGVDLGKDFPRNVYVPNDCKSLEEYLERFDLPLSLIQDEFSIAYVTKSLVERLYKDGYIYAEIRFAPQLHTRKGMSQEDALISALSGLKSALKDKPDFDANLIVCCMRQADYKTNRETVKLAIKYKDQKVCCLDLAGPEAFKTGDFYKPLFDEANDAGVNIIIHAGEACGSDEVIRAIDLLHAKRIGHGVHLDLTRENIRKVLEKRITFEFCPTSNLQTTSLPNYESVPLADFDKYGIPVTINSDNMTVSNTNVLKEYQHLFKVYKLKQHEVRHLLANSINAAFIPNEEKFKLLAELDKKINGYYLKIIEG
jgi:adenosine deaminase